MSPPATKAHSKTARPMTARPTPHPAPPDGGLAPDAGPRRLFYGWVMLPIATAGLIATAPGQTYGVSVFNEPMRAALKLTHGQLAAAYTFGTLLAALPITYVGCLMDRFGLRATMTIAVVLFGGACLVTAEAGGWPTLLASFFLLRLLGPGTLAFFSGNTLSFWFHRRLGMAEGVRHVGTAAAIAFVPALNLWLVTELGWQGAYRVLGLTVWAVMLPLMIFLYRNRPEDVGQCLDGLPPEPPQPIEPDGQSAEAPAALETDFTLGEAARTRTFWIVVGGTGAFSMLQTAVFFSLVPIFQDRGLSEADAVGLLSAYAASMAAMHLIGGFLADRLPTPAMLSTALGLLAAGLLTLRLMSAPWCGHLAGATMGVAQGLYFGASGPLWARYFGRMHLGKIRGLLMTSITVCSSLGPLLVGFARDHFGNHDLILAAFVLVPLPLAALAVLATPPQKHPRPQPALAGCPDSA